MSQRRSHRPAAHHTLIEPPTRLSAGLLPGLSLGLPVSCAGCGRWETALCPQCRELLEGEPITVEHAEAADDLDILALATYAGPVRNMVLGWKNGSREDLTEAMAQAGRRLGLQWASTHPPSRVWAEDPRDCPRDLPSYTSYTASPAPPVLALLVVPAPSGLARRLRGRLVAGQLADVVAQGIADQWAHRMRELHSDSPPPSAAVDPVSSSRESPAPLVLSTDLLRRRGGETHQAGRSSRQRRGNRAASPRLLSPVTGLPALLVDDVVTTGATLGSCTRALEAAGGRVLGALVMAAAPPATYTSVMVPARAPTTETNTQSSTDRRTETFSPAAATLSHLSACGDQKAPQGHGTLDREAITPPYGVPYVAQRTGDSRRRQGQSAGSPPRCLRALTR